MELKVLRYTDFVGPDSHAIRRLCYDKSDADNVIANQKYKRCLAIARERGIAAQMQHDFVMRFDNPAYIKRAEWNEKWRDRWRALADEPTWARFLQLIHKEVK